MKERTSESILYVLLVLIALLAPVVSYAGVTLIHPDSTITADVNTNPPITWEQGADYAQAQNLNFAGSFATTDGSAAFTISVSGLSGGSVIIDNLVNATAGNTVTSWKVKISSALSGTLTTPTTLKLRFWTGVTAPTADGDAQVEAVLDLTAAVDTESSTTITGNQTVFVQLVCEYASSTSGSSSVSIQPSSIVLA